jgi:hypothetical protein
MFLEFHRRERVNKSVGSEMPSLGDVDQLRRLGRGELQEEQHRGDHVRVVDGNADLVAAIAGRQYDCLHDELPASRTLRFGRWVRHSLATVEATRLQTVGQCVVHRRESRRQERYRHATSA